MPRCDAQKLFQVRLTGCNSTSDVNKHPRSTQPARHRDHLRATFSDAKPVRRTRGNVHQRAGAREETLLLKTEFDLTHHDVEGLVPRVSMRRRPATFGSSLEKDFVPLSRRTRCKHGDLLADNIEGLWIVLGGNNKRLGLHADPPVVSDLSP